MKDVYEAVPEFKNEHYLFRFVKESGLTETEKELILGKNAAALLGL